MGARSAQEEFFLRNFEEKKIAREEGWEGGEPVGRTPQRAAEGGVRVRGQGFFLFFWAVRRK